MDLEEFGGLSVTIRWTTLEISGYEGALDKVKNSFGFWLVWWLYFFGFNIGEHNSTLILVVEERMLISYVFLDNLSQFVRFKVVLDFTNLFIFWVFSYLVAMVWTEFIHRVPLVHLYSRCLRKEITVVYLFLYIGFVSPGGS